MTKNYHLLIETFSLTAYFRNLLNLNYSKELFNFLLDNSHLTIQELENRWDSFDIVFGKEYGNKISALSFATIIEARGILLNSIIKNKDKEKTLIIELASGFTPRGLDQVNNGNDNYIETDKENVINLKTDFYNHLKNIKQKTPKLLRLDVLNKNHFKDLYNLVKIEKIKNDKIENITLVNEGLLIYLNKTEQKNFFDNLRELAKLLKEINIKVNYLTIDIPTHENFTNWLVYEGFTLKDHLDVMSKVEPKIIEALHNTEDDFKYHNSLPEFKKYYYTKEIISNLQTPKLAKYKKIENLEEKINTFIKQDILFAWEIEL